MKINKIFAGLFIIIAFSISCLDGFGNVLPSSVNDIPNSTIGVYQTDKNTLIYEKPDKTSKVLFNIEIDYKNYLSKKTDNTFAVIIPKKALSYLFVTDTSEDEEWLEVIYDKTNNKKGWVYKNDEFQFMTWGLFFNLYGMKYGLTKLTNSPINTNSIYSSPDTNAQKLGEYTYPKYVHLTSIEGSWMLVSILDVTDNTCTGYIKWRTDKGQLILFPAIK
ncbi:hypothetical protein J6O48_06080 [bacterium]|nr:hypothetical protein [bacterium]